MNANQVAHSTVEELLREPQGTWKGLIMSHEACIAMRAQLTATTTMERDQNEGEVDNFPYTNEAKQYYALRMWKAMTDYSNYHEAKDEKSHFQVDRLKALSEVEMEVLSWEMLVSVAL